MEHLTPEELTRHILDRLSFMLKIGWGLIAGTFVVATWMANITWKLTDQEKMIQRHEVELKERADWVDRMSDRTARIEEQLKALTEITRETNQLLRGR